MKRWRITHTGGATNEVLGDVDIWTGKPDVQSVADLGENPLPPARPPEPVTLSKKAVRLRVIAGLMGANSSTNSAARARMQSLRSQVEALAADTDAKRRAIGALQAWKEDTEFTKVEFNTIVNDIDGGTDMTDPERDWILGVAQGSTAWPEA